MEGVQAFLESSSIGGLNHIASGKKYARLFWILAVLSGFSGAGYLIHLSFQSWSESPVTTTVETLPLSRIKLPKVTVCPPKNTFTDLNYDLMRAKNLVFDDDMRMQLLDSALGSLERKYFDKNWVIWNKVKEKNRFFNWYHGLTGIITPVYNYRNTLIFQVHTSAPNGVVTSQYFREPFQLNKLEKNITVLIQIDCPDDIKNDPNVTLHVKFEQSPALNHSIIDDWKYDIEFDSNKTIAYTPPYYDNRVFEIERKIEEKDLEKMNLLSMPGFELSWYYSGANVKPEPAAYDFGGRNKRFSR